MIYRGHIKNGKIVLEDDVQLADGTFVRVETVSSSEPSNGSGQSLFDAVKPLVGSLSLPEDYAQQHDHYVHGTSKK